MAKTATYTLDRFIADVKQVFASTTDPRAQAQAVASHMGDLLAERGWPEEKLQPLSEGGYGRVDLHVDEEYGHPGPGFLVMCSAQRPGQENSPHDHGASWVVYGVYEGAIEQTRWRWVYPEHDWTSPELKPAERYIQGQGAVAFFLPGEIHTTKNIHDGRSLVFRLEGQRLDRVLRHRYNQQENSARAFRAAT
jgi:predicted metal-dependent enzyme (double-stranded beta helix superfamily)